MTKNKKTPKTIQRFFTKTYNVFKLLLFKLWAGIRYIWDRPLIVGALLLIAAVFLANLIIQQTFKPYTNCAYLLITRLGVPAFFCEGYDVKVLGASVFNIPGLAAVMAATVVPHIAAIVSSVSPFATVHVPPHTPPA